jgi:hypothetical protein
VPDSDYRLVFSMRVAALFAFIVVPAAAAAGRL